MLLEKLSVAACVGAILFIVAMPLAGQEAGESAFLPESSVQPQSSEVQLPPPVDLREQPEGFDAENQPPPLENCESGACASPGGAFDWLPGGRIGLAAVGLLVGGMMLLSRRKASRPR